MNDINCRSKQHDQEAERLLIKKAKKNKKYFGELYKKYKEKIYHYILKKVSKEEIAQDLTSVTFEKALKKLDYFQWEGISFGSWLYKIARNSVYDHFRLSKADRKEKFEQKNIPEDSMAMELKILHDEQELELFQKISQFKQKDQYLLYYKYFVGMRNKQIAKETGLSVSNVATRLFRIRKKLRKLLDGDADE
jgi:RNA polymerase sigma-70 factor (ECF subfamily)